MNQKYMKRIADKVLDAALRSSGAVLIEGPKWCGKTRTAEEKAKSVLYMQDPDHGQSYLKAADTKPSLLLNGETPRLIDEWQMAPVLWDAVRFAVDKRRERWSLYYADWVLEGVNTFYHMRGKGITQCKTEY